MVTPLDVLKVDATILAGILILLTIVNIGDDYPSQLEKLETEHGNFINSIYQQAANLNQIAERYKELNVELQDPEITDEQREKIFEEANKLSVKLKVDDVLYSDEYLAQVNRAYESAKSDLEYKIEQEKNKDLSNDPTAWVYYVGVSFSVSAVLATFTILYEKNLDVNRSRLHSFLSNSSVGTMILGFLSLTGVFLAIGLR